jgi:hypothetical protein
MTETREARAAWLRDRLLYAIQFHMWSDATAEEVAEVIESLSESDEYDPNVAALVQMPKWCLPCDAQQGVDAFFRTQTPRPFHEWHEDKGPVLWWLWPIAEGPYVGTPLDLGRTVSFDVSVQVGVDLYEVKPTSVGMTGGWPWQGVDDDTEARLFWTELPCSGAMDTAIRDHIRGYPEDAA